MDNYVAPEIIEYAKHIVNTTIGTQTKVNSVEWSAGGLFNKVYCIHTSEGSFVLKIECDKIFFSTRKEQIENEVLGNKLLRAADIPCAPILAYDFTKTDIGVRYVFSERISNEILWIAFNQYNGLKQAEILRQEAEILIKMRAITTTHFGSLSPSGILGRHETWDEYSKYVFDLLIHDGEYNGIFTNEEASIMKEASQKAFSYALPTRITPSFVHGDFGRHNSIWGSLRDNYDKLYVIDFGNAYFGLPCFDEFMIKKHGDLRSTKHDIPDDINSFKALYENSLLIDFEKLWWRETEKLTEDYAHCLDWMTASIEATKKDTSRNHITNFVDSCRKVL